MEENNDGNQLLCVICGNEDPGGRNPNGVASMIEVPTVLESFRPSTTLEKTLEIFSTAVNPEHPSFDKMKLYSVLTSPEGGMCCISCSVILHKGVETAAQILQLETYLKNLGRDIFSVNSKLSSTVSKYSRMHSHKSRRSLYKTTVPPPPSSNDKNKNSHDIFSRFRNRTENCTECKCKIGSEIASKTTKLRNISTETSQVKKKTSIREILLNNWSISWERIYKKQPGVLSCPSCKFTVDIRTPSQKNLPLSSLSKADRHKLRRVAKSRVATHFRAKHIPSEANRKFHLLPDGKKVFLCPSSQKCSFTSFCYHNTILHYMRIHVPEKHLRDEDRVTCPEKSCTYEINIPGLSNGNNSNPVTIAKYRLAIHVIREHDIPSKKPSFKIVENTKKQSVVIAHQVKLEEGNTETVNAHRCTRCDYIDILPKNLSSLEALNYRNKFLKHFFDAHLKCNVKIPFRPTTTNPSIQ